MMGEQARGAYRGEAVICHGTIDRWGLGPIYRYRGTRDVLACPSVGEL